jgi:hypothetical protein
MKVLRWRINPVLLLLRPCMTTKTPELMHLQEMTQAVFRNDRNLQIEGTITIRRLLSNPEKPPIQQVIDTGVVPHSFDFLQHNDHEWLQFKAAWVLTNIASLTSEHTKGVVEANAVPGLVRLISSPNAHIREQKARSCRLASSPQHVGHDAEVDHEVVRSDFGRGK